MSVNDLLVMVSAVISSMLFIASGVRLARKHGNLAKDMKVISSKQDSTITSTGTSIGEGLDNNVVVPSTSHNADIRSTSSTGPFTSAGISSISKGASTKLSYSDLRNLLSKRFHGLVSSYGCLETPKEISLGYPIVPRGFEGSWSYCLLGCGGWGCTFLCGKNNEIIVFKVPRGFEGLFKHGSIPTVSEKLMRKIRERAEVIKALRHPNILRLLGVSEAAPVLIYEFADEGNVEWQLSKGWRPSVRDTVLLGIQIGDALRYIHSRGLVHGDVKPSNVFFVNGIAKIGDFSALTRLITKTSSHSRFGYTPGFRSPEQAYADLRLRAVELGLESRMDIYMLGNLLLYVLTGSSVDGEEAIKPGVVEEAVEEIEHAGLRNLIKTMLEPEPWKRSSSDEVVKGLLRLYYSLS